MFTLHPLITWGRFAIPGIMAFPGMGYRGPAHSRAARALARRGFPRTRARCTLKEATARFPPEGGSSLHDVFSDPSSPRQGIFRSRRVRNDIPPGPGGFPGTLIGRRGEKLYRFPRIDSSWANRRECFPARRWGSSSAGRAPRSQRGGRGFNPLLLHHLSFSHNKPASGD